MLEADDSVFRDLQRRQPHPHTLIYMRGTSTQMEEAPKLPSQGQLGSEFSRLKDNFWYLFRANDQLKTKYCRLKDNFRYLFRTNDQLKTKYCKLQTDCKSRYNNWGCLCTITKSGPAFPSQFRHHQQLQPANS
jgi:hypothetical protein